MNHRAIAHELAPLMSTPATYGARLRHLIPAYLGIGAATLIAYTALRWFFDIRTGWLVLDEDLWDFWLPFGLPWVVVLLALRKRMRLLAFRRNSDERRFFMQGVCAVSVGAATMVAQHLLKETTGGMHELASVNDLHPEDRALHYRIAHFAVADRFGGQHGTATTSGRYNNNLNYHRYFVAPIVDSTEVLSPTPLVWYGVEFREQMSNNASEAEKEQVWEALSERSLKEMETYDHHDLDHFVRVAPSEDLDAYLAAIKARTGQVTGNEIVLIPEREPYGAGNNTLLAWVLGFFGIGTGILLLILIGARCSVDDLEHFRDGRYRLPGEDGPREWLQWLVPRGDHFVTSLLLDINVLVFLAMVFTGVDVVSPQTGDLVQWGANTTGGAARGEWWRLFTSMFLHSGLMHLFMNAVGLVLAGLLLESLLGRVRYAVLYMASGLAASLTSLWWHTDLIGVGASGAIYGLFGAVISIMLFRRSVRMDGNQGILGLVVAYAAIGLLFGLFGNTDNAAHIGGLLCGFLLGTPLHFSRTAPT